MTDLRQTKEYAGYMESLGWKVFLLNLESGIENSVYVKQIPIVGRVAKLQRPINIKEKDITNFIEKNKIKVIYFEPSIHNSIFNILNFSSAKSSLLPSKTIQIDLTKSEKQMLKEMHPKTRYNIKIAQKRGVIIEASSDINAFITLWSKSALLRGMWLPQKKEIEALYKAFGKKAHILLAKKDSQIIAGILLICTPEIAYYMYAGSSSLGKKLFAPTLVAWEAIKLAKKLDCKVFDFEGIYDSRYHSQTKSWQGFTRFKKGFGGKIIEYPKTYVKYSNPLLKLLI